MINQKPLQLLARAQSAYARRFGIVILLVSIAFTLLWIPKLQAQEPLEPPSTPEAERGMAVYNDRCASCHGKTGKGDGEMAGDLPLSPRDLSSEEFRRTAVPAQMYQIITAGRLEAGMPPFGPSSSNPIPEETRWDLIAAIYSLGTAPETIEDGRLVYEENCLSCHGAGGAGNGPDATDLETALTDLTDLRYWSSRSNEMVFSTLQDEGIESHAYKLSDDELWDVIDYSRTFSYVYYDPQAALEPIASATISGLVTNGSSGKIISDGTVTLRAFTMDLEEVMTETTELQSDGRYVFELSDVAPDLVFMTSVNYDELNYNGSPDRLSRAEPELDMPIVVYDKTTDPAVVSIDQIHTVLDFVEDQVLVSEIYVISNNDAAVFLGKTGDAADGTFELVLPSGAQNVEFQRSFGSSTNFMPATELIQTDRGWADTLPLRPGQAAMNLLITYQIPFEDGVQIAHPVYYDTANATVIMPDAGVSLQGSDWVNEGTRQMGSAGTFLSYASPGLEAGEALSFELDGRINRSEMAAVVGGSTETDSTTGLILGATVFLLVVVGAVFTVRSWQTSTTEADSDSEDMEPLLQAVANLDDAYEAGAIEETQYHRQREKLMNELADTWPQMDQQAG